jgi:hypothetical protein
VLSSRGMAVPCNKPPFSALHHASLFVIQGEWTTWNMESQELGPGPKTLVALLVVGEGPRFSPF